MNYISKAERSNQNLNPGCRYDAQSLEVYTVVILFRSVSHVRPITLILDGKVLQISKAHSDTLLLLPSPDLNSFF